MWTTPMTSPTLSLVVPVFDDEAVIPELRRRLHAFLEGLGELWEVDRDLPDRGRLQGEGGRRIRRDDRPGPRGAA
jgi:hypothetical protein